MHLPLAITVHPSRYIHYVMCTYSRRIADSLVPSCLSTCWFKGVESCGHSGSTSVVGSLVFYARFTSSSRSV